MEEAVLPLLIIIIWIIILGCYLIYRVLCEIKIELHELHNDLKNNDNSESKTEEE